MNSSVVITVIFMYQNKCFKQAEWDYYNYVQFNSILLFYQLVVVKLSRTLWVLPRERPSCVSFTLCVEKFSLLGLSWDPKSRFNHRSVKIQNQILTLLEEVRRILGVSKAEERETGTERLCTEITAEKFPSLRKELNAHIHRGIIIGHMNVSTQKLFSNTHVLKLSKVNERKDFPGVSVGKNLPAKVGLQSLLGLYF